MMRASPFIGQTNAECSGQSGAERLVRRRKIVAWVVTLIVVCAVTSFSSGNRTGGYGVGSVPNAVRSATTPLTSYENGLVNTPDPIDNSSDRVVTGNVTGGKHFRGALPYRPPTSIDTPLGSTSLDPFLRRTAPSAASDDYLGTSSSFYSQTGTIASATSGSLDRGGVRSVPVRAYPDEITPDGATTNSRYTSGSDLRLPSIDTTSAESPLVSPTTPTGDLVTGWQTPAQPNGVVTREDYQQQMRQLQEKLAQVKAEVAQLERSFAAGKELGEPVAQTNRPDLPVAPDRTTQLGQPVSPSDASRRQELLQETARLLSATMGLPDETLHEGDAAPGQAEADAVSETATGAQPRLRLYEAQDHGQMSSGMPLSIDALVSPRTREAAGAGLNLGELPAVQRINEAARAFDRSGALANRPSAASPLPQAPRSAELPPVTAAAPRGDVPPPMTAAPTPSSQPNHDSSSARAFERYLQAGRQFMQQGSFHRAAEAFTLASAYRPNDARAYLGKGHALLAAGEYLDSALFLGKAVEMDLPCVLQRTDLIQLVGGPDAFIAYFNELDRLIEDNGGPQLQFLMAYIYYQMERPQEAKAAIDAAQRQLPSSMPIDLLRTAICR